jgi:hypothetical protein
MLSLQTHFFASRDDQAALLRASESSKKFKYVASGLFDTSEPEIYLTGGDIPTLGAARHQNAINGYCYLVLEPETPLFVKEIPQKHGGTKYGISQLGNENSITVLHGGFFENVLLYGKIGTVSGSQKSKEIYNHFLSAIRAQFVRIGSYYLGNEARSFLETGGRLTQAVQSPREYDLVLTN